MQYKNENITLNYYHAVNPYKVFKYSGKTVAGKVSRRNKKWSLYVKPDVFRLVRRLEMRNEETPG